MKKYFFSVCIEVNNRGATIYRSLQSILGQKIRDFECIIVDNNSTDNSMMEISSFFESKEFLENPFPYTIKSSSVGELQNWNKPLEYATGRYIAILEGDDQFLENHLLEAKNFLDREDGVGLYISQSTRGSNFPLSGVIKSNDYLNFQIKMSSTPAPSQSIFIREHLEKIFFYNVNEYIYAPEMDLYLRICQAGYDVFVSNTATINRDIEGRPKSFKLEGFIDRFTILKTWGPYLNNINPIQLRKSLCRQLFRKYLTHIVLGSGMEAGIWKVLSVELKYINYLLFLQYFLLKIVAIGMHLLGLLGIVIKVYKGRMNNKKENL